MATRVNSDGARRKLEALANILHRPLRDVLNSGARITAIEFAKTSQPFGTGSDAQTIGKKAVARDISKVYALARDAYLDIVNPRMAAAFWRAYKAGEFGVAAQFLIDFGGNLRTVPMGSFDGGAAHRSLRNATTGRISATTRPQLIVTNPAALFRYIETVQGDVGKGKGAWADVARQIGSIRGLRTEGDITANWITRKSAGLGRVYRGGTDDNPTISIQSTIPYASQILSGGALARSKAIGRHRMIENLEHAVRAETRSLRSAA